MFTVRGQYILNSGDSVQFEAFEDSGDKFDPGNSSDTSDNEHTRKKPNNVNKQKIWQVIELTVIQTNRYAAQCGAAEKLPKVRIQEWGDKNNEAIECFIGILIWMSLRQFPSIEWYWSNSVVYDNKINDLIPLNRFQLVLISWHFHNNKVITKNRLQKMFAVANLLIKNFQKPIVPK